jgi:biopolymer transport protein ExbD
MADSAPTPPPPIPPAVPAKSSNRGLIIVLCILGGLLLLVGGCVTTCVYYGAKKASEYAQTAEKNPAFATVSLIASLSPDISVVSKDAASGKITLRNTKSGETVTLDTNEYTPEKIGRVVEEFARGLPVSAEGDSAPSETGEAPLSITLAKDGTMEINGSPSTLAALPELARQAKRTNQDAMVLIISDSDSPVPKLTQVVEILRKEGLNNIRLQSR